MTPGYSTAPVDDVEGRIEDDDEPPVLTGPPSADTVWWGTFRADSNRAVEFLLGTRVHEPCVANPMVAIPEPLQTVIHDPKHLARTDLDTFNVLREEVGIG